MTVVDSNKVLNFCREVFKKAGVNEDHAFIMADALVEADLLNIKTHGVSRLNLYLGHIENGTINAFPQFKTENDFDSITVIDADKAMGPVAGDHAVKYSLEKAEENGVGITSVRNSSHMGALSVTAKKAVHKNMIGIVMSNTSPIMAAWGGGEAALGNNPLAIAVPGEEYPLVLDMAFSKTARGNIMIASREGKEIPGDWAVNSKGQPTKDPREALLGAVLPLAGHKGYCLAFMFDILCGVLSGASYGKNVGSFVPPDYEKPLDMGHFVMTLDIKKFMTYEEFQKRLKDYMEQIKESKKAENYEEIFIPGERSYKRYLHNLEKGIELSDSTLKMFKEVGKSYGVEL